MNKKLFTLLLLTVFVLAQFSVTSAAPVAGTTITLDPLPTFQAPMATGTLTFNMTLPGSPVQNPLVWWRLNTNPWSAALCWDGVGNVNNLTVANGSFPNYVLGSGAADQDVFDWLVTIVDTGDGVSCSDPANLPAASTPAMASIFIDGEPLIGNWWNPPSLEAVGFNQLHLSCNKAELWALYSDQWNNGATWATDGFSGFKAWNQLTNGTFAPPAPLGAPNALLSWMINMPGTATGPWSFTIEPEDHAGIKLSPRIFRNAVTPTAAEMADCMNFTDTAGHPNEVHVRYLADLGLIAGNPDGSYGVNNTLTRAEASALFEKANGFTSATLPVAPPSAACTFTDVSASDWFAGWVWQACADGFMNGLGGGMFGPADLLTRGQIVTIFNNISNMSGGSGGFLDFGAVSTVLSSQWTVWNTGGFPYLREAAFTDVSIGAFYVIPVQRAYGIGVADGTSATTFSPDTPILRGEFAKMLYRALSRN